MEYKKYNDYELIYMVRENEMYKSILYKKYAPILKKLSREYYQQYQYYGYEYEDFLQEANMLFEKALIHYDDSRDSMFYSFVILCVKRGLLTFCRNISRKKNLASFYFIDIDECEIADSRSDINNILNEYNYNMLVKQAILNMKIEYSTILELKVNGFSYSEISTLLDVSISTVEYRIRRIRKEITKYFYNA